MESFVVHEASYKKNWSRKKQVDIDVFNVEGNETSADLLAEPQNTNYNAYCVLRQAVYPLGKLPYHQPIDAMRIYLKFLESSRYEILNTFQKPFSPPSSATTTFTSAQVAELSQIFTETLERATGAEYLGIIQEEYIILTEAAFWPKRYFEITSNTTYTTDAYQQAIGVKLAREYWGYKSDALMRDTSTAKAAGLSFVKAQFLPRSNMVYTDVVNLVKTNFVNPVYPAGQDLVMLQSIRFSYRFLQTLVNTSATNTKDKFSLLITFLEITQPWVNLRTTYMNAGRSDLECKPTISCSDISSWVYRWFDCLADVIVLESGEGPTLPVSGRLVYRADVARAAGTTNAGTVVKDAKTAAATPGVARTPNNTSIGILYADGRVLDLKHRPLAVVGIDGVVYMPDGTLLASKYPDGQLQVYDITPPERPGVEARRVELAYIDRKGGYLVWSRNKDHERVTWNAVVDSCNIDKVRILHLDGSELHLDEWDRMQRFIRLWLRLGWTIDQTDKALMALSNPPPATVTPTPPSSDGSSGSSVGFGDFTSQDCRSSKQGDGGHCSTCKHRRSSCTCGPSDGDGDDGDGGGAPIPTPVCQSIVRHHITPDFLNQLVSLKKLAALTDLEIIQLLALWGDIDTFGDSFLYSTLFLTHNLLGIDNVFQADSNGNYLVTTTPISSHLPVILAAFRLTSDFLTAILTHENLTTANLTLGTVSVIYRYALLSQNLGLKIPLLINAMTLFGNPFKDATTTLDFVTWYNTMVSQGFTVSQLNYVINGVDNPLQPLGPTQVEILKTTKSLYDGLNAIDLAHPDITAAQATITAATVSQSTSLLYDPSLVAQINGLLEGTTTYVTNAPIALTITVPDSLKAKLSYSDDKTAVGTNRVAKLTVVGILTSAETATAKSLASSADWAAAIDRVAKQALTFFKTSLSDIPRHHRSYDNPARRRCDRPGRSTRSHTAQSEYSTDKAAVFPTILHAVPPRPTLRPIDHLHHGGRGRALVDGHHPTTSDDRSQGHGGTNRPQCPQGSEE